MKKIELAELQGDPAEERQDDQLEADPRFLKRIDASRRSLEAGQGTRLEDLD